MTPTIEKIPSWALEWLINGDASGLDDSEMSMIDKWLGDNLCLYVCPPASDAEPYFTSHPAFGLPCEVYECECMIYNK